MGGARVSSRWGGACSASPLRYPGVRTSHRGGEGPHGNFFITQSPGKDSKPENHCFSHIMSPVLVRCVENPHHFFVSNADMGEGGCTKALEKLWKSGREGTLCPLEQAKAWGFREAQRARGEEENHQETTPW